jgi:hypothetical protein
LSRRILILLTAVVLVWVGVYLVSLREEARVVSDDLWPEIAWEQLTELEVAYGGRSYALIKADDGWRARIKAKRIQPRVRTEAVRSLVEFLSRHQPRRDLGELRESETETYGLKPPEAALSLVSGQKVVIRLGARNPSRDGVYAVCSLAPDRLLLLDSGYQEQVKKPARQYFDRRLVVAREQEVRSFGLTRKLGRPAWRIGKQGEQFDFLLPEKLRELPVAESEARFYLHNLLSMEAGELLLDPVEFELHPMFRADVQTEGGREASVNVFREQEKLGETVRHYANSTWQPGVFLLGVKRVDQLNRTAFNLQRRNVVSLDASAVKSFSIVQNDQALGAVKNATGWRIRNDEKKLLGIDMSLWRLTDLQFEAEPVEQLPETAQRAMAWTLADAQGDQLVRVVFYDDPELPEGLCWLFIDGKDKYFPVSNQLLKDLQGQLP